MLILTNKMNIESTRDPEDSNTSSERSRVTKTCLERYKLTIEVTGWLGCCAILISYVGKDRYEETLDAALNIGGSGALLVSCIPKKAWQPIFVNSVWIIATIYNFYY